MSMYREVLPRLVLCSTSFNLRTRMMNFNVYDIELLADGYSRVFKITTAMWLLPRYFYCLGVGLIRCAQSFV